MRRTGPASLAARYLPLALLAAPAGCKPAEPPATTVTAATPTTLRYTIEGMHCDGCVAAINGKVTAIEGVSGCTISLENRSAEIAVRDASLDAKVREAITRLGYRIPE
jgi:copper chaperone CopZ